VQFIRSDLRPDLIRRDTSDPISSVHVINTKHSSQQVPVRLRPSNRTANRRANDTHRKTTHRDGVIYSDTRRRTYKCNNRRSRHGRSETTFCGAPWGRPVLIRKSPPGGKRSHWSTQERYAWYAARRIELTAGIVGEKPGVPRINWDLMRSPFLSTQHPNPVTSDRQDNPSDRHQKVPDSAASTEARLGAQSG